MAKPISQKSKNIIKLLLKGASVNSLAKKYPRNTVLYYKRKLFFPERHKKFLEQVKKYQRNKK